MEIRVYDLIMKEDQFKNFIEFLNEYAKEGYNLKAYVDDLVKQYGNSGSCYYELSRNESKDKKTHLFFYELTKVF